MNRRSILRALLGAPVAASLPAPVERDLPRVVIPMRAFDPNLSVAQREMLGVYRRLVTQIRADAKSVAWPAPAGAHPPTLRIDPSREAA